MKHTSIPYNLVTRPWVVGEQLPLTVEGPTGHLETWSCTIEAYVAGGFAGDIWRVRTDDDRCIALKVFSAGHGLSNRLKKGFRDVLHAVWFQSPFPYRAFAPAARYTVLARELIYLLGRVEFGRPMTVRPYGHFWSAEHRAFGVAMEWFDGRGLPMQLDQGQIGEECLQRWTMQHTWERWMTGIGFGEHAAQIYVGRRPWIGAWMTMANMQRGIHEHAGRYTNDSEEWMCIDLDPALPHVFWCFPYHTLLTWRGLSRGVLPSFDRVDFQRLDRYLEQRKPDIEHVLGDEARRLDQCVSRLQEAAGNYARSRLDLCGHRLGLLTRSELRHAIRSSTLSWWYRRGDIDLPTRNDARLPMYLGGTVLQNVPIVGRRIMRWCWNRLWRRRVTRWCQNARRRRAWCRARAARCYLRCRGERRLPQLPQQFQYAWWVVDEVARRTLPVKLHRVIRDTQYRRVVLKGWRRFLYESAYREELYRGLALSQARRWHAERQIRWTTFARLQAIVARDEVLVYLRGTFYFLAPKVVVYSCQAVLLLLGAGMGVWSLIVLGVLGGGLYREVVVLLIAIRHPSMRVGAALATAWIPKLGNSSLLLLMWRELPDEDRLLLVLHYQAAIKAVLRAVPVLGSRDGLLEAVVVRVAMDAVPWMRRQSSLNTHVADRQRKTPQTQSSPG